MKIFLRLIFILLFSFLSIPFLILLFTRVNSITKEEIKTQLIRSEVYSKAVTELTKQVDNALTNENSDQISALIAPIIKKEITPEYLQLKTEKLIDDTNYWMVGKNNTPPVISFQDLKEKILAQNARTITTLQQLSKEYELQKEELKKEAVANGELPENQDLPSFDFNKIIDSDFSIPVGKNLNFLKTFYWYVTTGLPIIGIVLFILLAVIIFLSDSKSAKLRWLGLTFLSSAIWNTFPLLILFFSSKLLITFLVQNKDIPSFLVSLSTGFLPLLVDKYTKFAGTAIVIFLLLFLVCLLASFFMKTPKNPTKKKPISSKKKLSLVSSQFTRNLIFLFNYIAPYQMKQSA